MPDETLVEPFAVQEFFVDGFDGYEIADGILKCAGYRLSRVNGDRLRVVAVRIVMPLASLGEAIENALSAANNTPMPALLNSRLPRKHLS